MSPQAASHRRRTGRTTGKARGLKNRQIMSSISNSINNEEQLSRARKLEQDGHIEEAISAFEALLIDKENDAQLHEELALLYMQAGTKQQAEHNLRVAIRVKPHTGFEKYAYLAQLLGNTVEALNLAQRGVDLIRTESAQLCPQQHAERLADLHQFAASANCAVAEIALAIIEDSNDPAVAASMDVQVEQAVTAALAVCDPGTNAEVEAILSLANLRLSQGRHQEARSAMTCIVHKMAAPLECLDSDDVNDSDAGDAIESLPPVEIRIAIAKQLIEVEMWQSAVSVLSSIMWECDFNIEVWYMLAVAYWKLGDIAEAQSALSTTRHVLHNPDGYDGDLEEQMIDKLLTEIGTSNDSR